MRCKLRFYTEDAKIEMPVRAEDTHVEMPLEGGVPGQDGRTPVKGVDYFTPDEIEEIETAAAAKVVVPTKLSELEADETHRTVTDEEKAVWLTLETLPVWDGGFEDVN